MAKLGEGAWACLQPASRGNGGVEEDHEALLLQLDMQKEQEIY